MYGQNKDAEGKEIPADSGYAQIITGERVKGNEILSLEFHKDLESQEVNYSRAELKFKQANGAIFTITFFDSNEDWAIASTNRTLLHIFTKVVSKDEYLASCAADNFQSFIENIKTKIIPKSKGMKFTLKIVWNTAKKSGKSFTGFPNFPNFIELDGTEPSTLSTNPKYDVYVRPEMGNAPTKDKEDSNKEEVPF